MLYYQTVFRGRGKKGNFCTVFRLAADRLEISLEGVGYETAYKEQVKKRRGGAHTSGFPTVKKSTEKYSLVERSAQDGRSRRPFLLVFLLPLGVTPLEGGKGKKVGLPDV